jgi:inosine-uridine nucleoside N-ribohydrolase
MAARKIIIDTDPGVDDAMAIFFALKSPELDVIGLTTIFGNVSTQLATTNALRLLDIAGRPDIPVAHGAEDALVVHYDGPHAYVHGEDGQGNVNLPPSPRQAVTQPAAQFIVEQIMQAPGEVTLVPIGPLTNIALALRLEPRIAQHVQEIVLMGGNALGLGNATPAAEANIYHDAEAAEVVFGASWPVTMVGLDVTHEVIMTPEQLATYGTINDPMCQHIARIVPHYQHFYDQAMGLGGKIFIHDSSTIAYLVEPALFKTEQWPVRVDTSNGVGRGKTWPSVIERYADFVPGWKGRPKVTVCVGVDGAKSTALELSRMRGQA